VALRVAILGSGWVAPYHAHAVAAHAGAELVAAANWRPGSLATLAERFAIPRTSTRWQDVVADPTVDAVVVATPNALHAVQAIAALEAGKHVLVEKPMARTLAEADAILAAADASGGTLMVAHCWRFHADVRALRARIAAGDLGRIVKTRGYGAHVDRGPGGWFVDPELAGGGALLDMGVHAIDTARFLLGDPTPARVHGVIRAAYRPSAVDDDGILVVEWSDGAASIVECGWWQPPAGGAEADTEVYGTGGYARVWPDGDASAGHLDQAMFDAQMAAFVDAAAGAGDARPDARDGRVVASIVEDAYRSAAASAGVGR
jgi:predicted dehydrogenase